MENPKYNCSQQELYEACKLLANSLEEHLASFTAYKAKYNAGTVTDFRTQRANARAIPDLDMRTANREVLRIELISLVKNDVFKLYNRLRGYMKDAYTNPDILRVRMQEAGYGHYDAAMNNDWEEVNYMLEQTSAFMVIHKAELEANDNMPAGFDAEIDSTVALMDTKISAFLNYMDNSKVGTATKNAANNALFDKAMDICEDGQIVFVREPELKEQFVWSSILDIVTPPGAAGFKVYVRDAVTFLPRVNAQVKIQLPGQPVTTLFTDADGFVHFTSLAAGTYEGNITGEGYAEFNFSMTIVTGVTSTKTYDTAPL